MAAVKVTRVVKKAPRAPKRRPQNPKNQTRYVTLDRMAEDPRIVEIWSEESAGDGIWATLAEGYNWDGCSCIHEWSVKDLFHALNHRVTEGPTY